MLTFDCERVDDEAEGKCCGNDETADRARHGR
jgi:hypothetical protein